MLPLTEASPSRAWLLPFALGWSLLVLAAGIVVVGPAAALVPLYGLHDPRVGPAGLGSFVAHAILCGSDRRRTRVLRAGFLLEVLRFFAVTSAGVSFESALLSIGYGFFVAALADFLLHREWRNAGLALLVPLGMTNAAFGLGGIVKRFTPLTYDGALYALDSALRVPFSAAAGKIFAQLPAIAVISLFAYALLPGAIAAGLGYEEYNYRRGKSRGVGVNLLLAYAVSGTVAALLYIWCPATGPAHAFAGAFPSALPDPRSVPLDLALFTAGSPRNAMPSFHFVWAVILTRAVAGSRASVRAVAISFAVLTAIATIGSGEHYIVDLIAAAPFVVVLESVAAHRSVPRRARITRSIAGFTLFAMWIAMVKNGPAIIPFLLAHTAAMWAIAILTIVISLLIALPPVRMMTSRTRSAVILARGLGTRMRRGDPHVSLGRDQAAAAELGMKGMIPIGRPFLDYLMSALADAGYARVCLVIGPEHDAVVRHYTVDSVPQRIAVEFATQEKPLGTADAVLAAERFCGDEPFVVLNSDNYYPAEALRRLRETDAPAIAGFARSSLIEKGNVPPERVTRFGALTIGDDGFLLRIVPREGDVPRDGEEIYASMNCWLFDSRIFDACRRVEMSPRNELELPRAVQLGIDAMGMKVRVVKLRLPVLDMSSRGDIASVESRLKTVDVRL